MCNDAKPRRRWPYSAIGAPSAVSTRGYAAAVNDLLGKVLDLQPSWTAANTEKMQERGVVVRQQLPDLLRAHGRDLSAALGTSLDNLGVEGRDGTGLKSEIPWVRVFGREQSPSSTTGWYVVYLFSASGRRVYLSLNQGTTIWTEASSRRAEPKIFVPVSTGRGHYWRRRRPRARTCTKRFSWTPGPLLAVATAPGTWWPSHTSASSCPRGRFC